MDHQIARANGVAVYRQIAESIRQRIEVEGMRPGDRLPAEDVLSTEYGVARMTIRQALQSLSNDGVLVRRHGHGTFVASPKIHRHATRMTGFHEDMLDGGMKPRSILLESGIEAASPSLQKRLNLTGPDQMVFIRRVRLSNDEPAAITESYFRADLCSKLLTLDIESNSLYALLERDCGLELGWVEQSIEACPSPKEAARHLELRAGAPLLKVERLTYLKDGSSIGLSDTLYRSDRYVLTSVLYR